MVMDRVIKLEAAAQVINDAGTPVTLWTEFATLRAELVQQDTEEFLRGGGEQDVESIAFRTRHFPGASLAHRVIFDGRPFDIEALVPIGRRKGFEIRCVNRGRK